MTTQAQFEEYDAENPSIWREIERVAMKAIERGYQRWSIRGIIEVVRWETSARAKDGVFKVSDQYLPYYARKFRDTYPEHKDFFQFKQSKADLEQSVPAIQQSKWAFDGQLGLMK